MKIGLISDTHNEVELTKKALEIFKEYGITHILHAGDLTSSAMLDLFIGFKCNFVLGNGDIDVDLINNKSEKLGFGPIKKYLKIQIGKKKIMLFHGDDVPLYRNCIKCHEYDYIIKGHTHMFEDYLKEDCRIINPGAIYRGLECTIAILNTETDTIEKIEVSI